MRELASRVCKLSWEHWTAWQNKIQSIKEKCVWKPLPPEKVKVNVDMVVRDQFAVIAALIRDHQGEVKGSTFVKIEAVQPLEGDATAAKLGVEFAKQMGFWDIIMEGDSAWMIKAIQMWPKRTE